jgi:hypothetical protein
LLFGSSAFSINPVGYRIAIVLVEANGMTLISILSCGGAGSPDRWYF